MHPGFFHWWKRHHHHHDHGNVHAHAEHGPGGPGEGSGPWGSGPWGAGGHGGPWEGPGGCGPRGAMFGGFRGGPFAHRGGPECEPDGGGFGVRRPLRFLAYKLELEEKQVGELAAILDALKTERAQASVDLRRTIAAFAEAVDGAEFDEAKAREAGELRVKSAERLRDAVTTALAKMHAMLDAEQRKRLSYLLRTGALAI